MIGERPSSPILLLRNEVELVDAFDLGSAYSAACQAKLGGAGLDPVHEVCMLGDWILRTHFRKDLLCFLTFMIFESSLDFRHCSLFLPNLLTFASYLTQHLSTLASVARGQ